MSTSRSESATGRLGLLPRGSLAIGLSVLANAAVLWVALATGFAPDIRAYSWSSVVALTAVGAAGATATYWLVRRRASHPDRTFVRIAAAALLLSFIPDIGLYLTEPAATAPAVAVLMAMHAITAAICVGVLTGWLWNT